MQAKTITEVMNFLHAIIETSEGDESALGYFPALYIKVTKTVKLGIAQRKFEDNERMERMVVAFANSYLRAYTPYKNGETPVTCWQIAFQKAETWWPIVLQHLLGAMNAHINYDLGVAAATIAPGNQIHGFENDFNMINAVLASLVDQVNEQLGQIWPFFKKILKWSGNFDNFLINFSMKLAREGAWRFAVKLAYLEGDEREAFLKERDQKVFKKSPLVYSPGWIVSALYRAIRLREKGSVAGRIQLMAGHKAELSEGDMLALLG